MASQQGSPAAVNMQTSKLDFTQACRTSMIPNMGKEFADSRSFDDPATDSDQSTAQMPQFSATGLNPSLPNPTNKQQTPYPVSPYVRDYQMSSTSSRNVQKIIIPVSWPNLKLIHNRQYSHSPQDLRGPQASDMTQDWGLSMTDMQNLPENQPFQHSPQLQGPRASPAGSVYHPGSQSNTPQYQSDNQLGTPSPTLVQLGASQNYLINSQPAPYIKVLDIDPTYHRSGPPSPNASPCECPLHSFSIVDYQQSLQQSHASSFELRRVRQSTKRSTYGCVQSEN